MQVLRDSDIKSTVTLSNGHVIHSAQEGYLDLPTINQEGCKVQTFKDEDLKEFFLLNVGQFCDAG
jgi:hypothetical protein